MRCDSSSLKPIAASGGFNPHTYMRCDWSLFLQQSQQNVSIHTPTWGVTYLTGVHVRYVMFQSTHLHEVWHVMRLFKNLVQKFQSTHLHEVWLGGVRFGRISERVSIHTPTWGVTLYDVSSFVSFEVSIHTPTWGVTLIFPSQQATVRCFNPHTYMRCDNPFPDGFDFFDVSIHTPTWGVTQRNSATALRRRFQSTHLHEVWPYAG